MTDVPQKRMRALVEIQSVDFIHNDLSSAAFYFSKRVCDRHAQDDHEGIFLEMIAALTMTAFALEAHMNFVGPTRVTDWQDRWSVSRKLREICKVLSLVPDYDRRPFATVEKIVSLRNTLAHGKPETIEIREEAEGTHNELMERVRGHKNEWAKVVTPEFVSEAFEDVEDIWKQMLAAADIRLIETLSGGSGGITFLSHLEER